MLKARLTTAAEELRRDVRNDVREDMRTVVKESEDRLEKAVVGMGMAIRESEGRLEKAVLAMLERQSKLAGWHQPGSKIEWRRRLA